MRSIARLAVMALALAGCGSSTKHKTRVRSAPIPTASCAGGRALAQAPLAGESGVYRAGPVTLAMGEDLAQMPAAASGTDGLALLTGDRPVVLRVAPGSPVQFSLDFTPPGIGDRSLEVADGFTAVRFPACGGHAHRFPGGESFAGAGCVRLDVQVAQASMAPMWIPVGNSLRGCPSTATAARLPVESLPFVGIACGTANSIACERVGVGVRTEIPATLVVVEIAGHLVTLSPPPPPRAPTSWLGYLQAVSLRRGPLRVPVPPNSTRWFGSPEVHPWVRVIAFFPDGQTATAAARVLLHPGFG